MNGTHPQPLMQLESPTLAFRERIARKHKSKARAAHRAYTDEKKLWQACLAGSANAIVPDEDILARLRAGVSSERWHEGRSKGQLFRFRNLAGCGKRTMISRCQMCGVDGKPTPEGCGVTRLCPKCSIRKAKQRRARFGRSRHRVWLQSKASGALRKDRTGGCYSDKMLTLTIPHFLTQDLLEWRKKLYVAGEASTIKELNKILHCGDGRELGGVVKQRIAMLFEACPRFIRRLRRHWKELGEREWAYHRSFEWTPGKDGLGHPHFHFWLWCPFIDADLVSEMWTEALLEVGAPPPQTASGFYRADIRSFRDVGGHELSAEILKGGERRRALEYSRLYHGPSSAFEYASGWTVADVLDQAPDVVASIYEALEGRRLVQASRGFFERDAKCKCRACLSPEPKLVRFERTYVPRNFDPATFDLPDLPGAREAPS